ncbi:MAG: hypothetical protein BM564_08470 [Bacteroidetes bacterium MedPE-SWsnd-G2]|nr:MAG: hypothetical protein BM564_08470 [Bacteroidetes bacterium MedPE-SWsnd-G2]
MKWTFFFTFLVSVFAIGQTPIETTSGIVLEFDYEKFVSVDNNQIAYATDYTDFFKISKDQKLSYSNVQLGQISSANSFNSLKLNVFYKNFNTVIILDNRLAEIYTVDFNQISPYKNVSMVSTGYDNTIWIINQDLNRLELFDFQTNKSRLKAVPIEGQILDMTSNYNYCWVLTDQYILTYDYFGAVISMIPNQGFNELGQDSGNLVLKNEEKLYYLAKNTEEIRPIQTPQLLINQFSLTNETLYIYSRNKLHQFQLKF